MQRNIVDILVFKTPFEEDGIFLDKFRKINEMFEDYLVNSGLDLEKIEKENETYKILNYSKKEYDIFIEFAFKKNLNGDDYFPAIIINYSLNEFKFEKENIESFLNDNIKFIYNVFFQDFFIEYDDKFSIVDINKGKKVDYKDLKKFDLENKNSKENKQTLDSMMFLYFNLLKSIFEINSNIDNINSILGKTEKIDLESNLEIFKLRGNSVKEDLVKTSVSLKKQIDTFVNFIK